MMTTMETKHVTKFTTRPSISAPNDHPDKHEVLKEERSTSGLSFPSPTAPSPPRHEAVQEAEITTTTLLSIAAATDDAPAIPSQIESPTRHEVVREAEILATAPLFAKAAIDDALAIPSPIEPPTRHEAVQEAETTATTPLFATAAVDDAPAAAISSSVEFSTTDFNFGPVAFSANNSTNEKQKTSTTAIPKPERTGRKRRSRRE